MRYACIGHRVYFENHFIEGHRDRSTVRGFDYDHYSLRPVAELLAFAPDVTLIYRPELYSSSLLRMFPGTKIGFSSEPLPTVKGAETSSSSETNEREAIYRRLDTTDYDYFFHYDEASATWFNDRGFRVDGYRPLPVDCDTFHPLTTVAKEIDFLFVGKATPHRVRVLDRFRMLPFNFLWIAHGISGRALADVIRRSRCVLNVHADGRKQLEPRILLAAACGTPVVSEPLGVLDFVGQEVVYQRNLTAMSCDELRFVLERTRIAKDMMASRWETLRPALSAKQFVDDCLTRPDTQ
jgi:hypothetical protein